MSSGCPIGMAMCPCKSVARLACGCCGAGSSWKLLQDDDPARQQWEDHLASLAWVTPCDIGDQPGSSYTQAVITDGACSLHVLRAT